MSGAGHSISNPNKPSTCSRIVVILLGTPELLNLLKTDPTGSRLLELRFAILLPTGPLSSPCLAFHRFGFLHLQATERTGFRRQRG